MTACVFAEWSLRREAPRWRPSVNQMVFLIPMVLAGLEAALIWPDLRHPGVGREAIRHLVWIAALSVFAAATGFGISL